MENGKSLPMSQDIFGTSRTFLDSQAPLHENNQSATKPEADFLYAHQNNRTAP